MLPEIQMINMKKILFILSFYFIFTFLSLASDWHGYKIEAINGQENLPSKSVLQLFQDSEGYMWFATMNGLCKYDGYKLTVYKSSYLFPDLLHSNIVRTIIEDTENRIWIGTAQGINILDKTTGKIEAISNDSIPDNYIQTFLLTRDGIIWVGTQAGLLRYNKEKRNFTLYKNCPGDTESICGNSVRALHEDASGNIWIGTFNDGICRYDRKKDKFISYPFPSSLGRMSALFEDNEHTLWLGAWANGVVKMERNNKAVLYTTYQQNVDFECLIHSIVQLPNDTIWVGTSRGLARVEANGKLVPVDKPDNLSYSNVCNDEINYLYFDKNHILWVATQNSGVYMIYPDQSPFVNYPLDSATGLNQPLKVNTMYRWSKNEMLLGIDKAGLALFNNKTRKLLCYWETPLFSSIKKQFIGNIQTIFKHPSKDELWLGSEYGGMITCELKNNKVISAFQHFPYKGYWLAGDVVKAIITDKNQNIWIATNNGLNILTAKGDTLTYSDYGQMQSVYQDSSGDIWCGTYYKGLYRIKNNTDIYNLSWDVYNSENRLLGINEINCIYEDSKHNLWVGGRGGLFLYNQKKNLFQLIPFPENISGDVILNITEYDDKLILGTNRGLVLYSFSLEQYTLTGDEFIRKIMDSDPLILNTEDGVLDNVSVRNSILNTEEGIIYYGTPKGLYALHPDRIQNDSSVSKTVITDFRIMHTSFNDLPSYRQKQLAGSLHPLHSKHITLSATDNNIGIEFATLSYIHTDKNKYAYKLDEFDDNWVYVDASRRSAYYTNLPAGEYRFFVKSINRYAPETKDCETFYIKVLPPFYKSDYAYALYIMLMLGVIYLSFRFVRYRFRLNQALKIEQIERVKSEELNQSKFRFFTNISHEFLTPLSIISCSFEELKTWYAIDGPVLQAIKSNVFRLNKLIEEILEFQKAENNQLKLKVTYADIASFITGICRESFSLLVKSRRITLRVECEPEHIAAWFDRDKIDKIMYNLLSNAVKFSFTDGRGEIVVSLRAEEKINEFQSKYLTIRVFNTGKGISESRLPHIFTRFYESDYKQTGGKGNGIGLALTKSLVELHNGTITVNSRVDEWTEFIISIPISKDAFTPGQIGELQTEVPITFQEGMVVSVLPQVESGNRYSILLVEDDIELLASLQRLLQNKYNVTTAANGLDGLICAEKINPDLIISDVMMPKMDGFEFCKRIKDNILTSHIPIILLTAKITGNDQLEGLKCGADVYITKPFNYTILEAQLESTLSNRTRLVEKFRSSPLTHDISLSVSSQEEKFLENAIRVVTKNMENPDFDLKMFLEQMQVSNSMLYRKLKALTSLSPNEFIRNIRLKAACKLLLEKKGNISDIAFMVGFSDAKYFSACFKKEFNISPGEYMERQTNATK